MKINKKILISFYILFSFLTFISAEEITFSADKMNGSTGETEYTKLSGNAFIKTDSMEIRADEIILSGNATMVEVYSITGAKVLAHTGDTNSLKVNLNNGIYIVKAYLGTNHVVTSKVVVK